MTTARVRLPPKLVSVFTPARGEVDYRASYGGRGSGKSFSFAKMAAVWGYAEPLRILCTREYQTSIKESFHAELRAAIASEPWLEASYDVGVDYLRGHNGTEFLFRGLRQNLSNIKSTAAIDLTIVEEAEDIPEPSWLALEATVFRQPRAELWSIWNPRVKGSPVDLRFRKHPPARARIAEMNWPDNPWFPAGLETLRKRQQELLDPNTYAHIWEGAYLEHSAAQVFHGKWRVHDFEVGKRWQGPYYGLDFGFSQDPTAAVECWIHDNRLYVRREAGRTGLDIDQTSPYLREKFPGIAQHAVRADSARPESISYLVRHGLPRCTGVKKGKGSVEDGVTFIRSFETVVLHPECQSTIDEFRHYSYATDPLSGEVRHTLVDAHNHFVDAIRYALEPIMKRGSYTLKNVA